MRTLVVNELNQVAGGDLTHDIAHTLASLPFSVSGFTLGGALGLGLSNVIFPQAAVGAVAIAVACGFIGAELTLLGYELIENYQLQNQKLFKELYA